MQAEGADAELVLAAGDPERRLVLVLLPDAELHVGHREVQLGEEARAARLVDEPVDVRQRLHRPLLDGVEPAVVLAEASRPFRLPPNTTEAACEAHDGTIHPWFRCSGASDGRAQWQNPSDTKRLFSLLEIRAINIHRKV